jgi:hypothetical protein
MIAPWSVEQEPGLAAGHRTRRLNALHRAWCLCRRRLQRGRLMDDGKPLLGRRRLGCSGPRGQPGWEPFAVACCGRPWAPVDSLARCFRLWRRPWTSLDPVWRSTDQEVGGSSPFGRAAEPLLRRGFLSSADGEFGEAGCDGHGADEVELVPAVFEVSSGSGCFGWPDLSRRGRW